MMKATVLLFVALAVTVNGLGFPNFNLGCPFAQANRFANANELGELNTLGVIPYCRVVNGMFVNDLANQLVNRYGYSPVYDAAPTWVIIKPVVPLSALDTSDIAFPGIIVSVGTQASQMFDSITQGTMVGFTYSGCTSVDTTRIAGATFGLGLTSNIACPWSNVLGRYEFARSAGGSAAGRAQSLTLPRPYIFYGL